MRFALSFPLPTLLAFATLLAACSAGTGTSTTAAKAADATTAQDTADDVSGADTSTLDTLATDSGASDSTSADTATSPPDANGDFAWLAPTGPRRGPIAIHTSAPPGLTAANAAQAMLLLQSGGQWLNATLLQPPGIEGDHLVFVWDSWADVSTDASVAMRVTVGAQLLEHTLEVRNAADTPRVVLTAHPSKDLPSGGSGAQNREIGELLWISGSLVNEEYRVDVGKGPESLSAAPHGRATANVDGTDGTFSLIATPLDAKSKLIQVLFTQKLPHGWAADLAWSRDGRSLYVLGTAGELTTQLATLWRYDPAEDLSALGEPTALATFDRPAMDLAVERNHPQDRDEWAYVVLGQGPDADVGQVAAVARHGGMAAPLLDTDVGVPNDFAVSPAGGLALVSSDLFGNLLVRYDLGKTVTEKARFEPKKVPYGLVFHPGSTLDKHVLLVSNLDKNSVTPVTVTASEIKEGPAVTGLSLAAEMDIVERGPNLGVVLVSALNQLIAVQLQTDGTVKKLGVVKDFGSGTSNFTGSVAIQR